MNRLWAFVLCVSRCVFLGSIASLWMTKEQWVQAGITFIAGLVWVADANQRTIEHASNYD